MRTFLFFCIWAYSFSQNASAQTLPTQGLKSSLSTVPSVQEGRNTAVEFDKTGWRFEVMPRVEPLDDKSGAVRFKLVVNSAGTLDSVLTVSSTVSARQEALCRQTLQAARLIAVNGTPQRAIGFYTFKFTVR